MTTEDKRRIRLICKLFAAQAIYIDGVRCNLPKDNITVAELLENGKKQGE